MENQINNNTQNLQQSQMQMHQENQTPVDRKTQYIEHARPGLNYWKISTIVFVILFLSALGMYAFKTQMERQVNLSDLKQQPVATLNPITTTTPSQVSAPTVNWKVFTDKTNNFHFKYPSSWLVENDTQEYLTWEETVNIFSSKDTGGQPDVLGQIFVWKQSVSGRKITLQTFLEEPPTGGFQEVIIDGYKIYRGNEIGSNNTTTTLVFEKNERIIQITFIINHNQNKKNNIIIVNDIIKSFKLE